MTESGGTGGGSAATPAAPTVYARVVGTLEEFDPKGDSMAAYIERALMYLDANNVPQNKKAATLLSAIGKNTFHMLRNLMAPAKLQDQSFEDIVKALLDHYEPKQLVIAERFNFNRRQQGPSESVADYVAELRRLSMKCEFGPFLDDALRDRFVCGLQNEAVQKKLLLESKLTFPRAVEIAQNMEAAASKTRQLHEGDALGAGAGAVIIGATVTGVTVVTTRLPNAHSRMPGATTVARAGISKCLLSKGEVSLHPEEEGAQVQEVAVVESGCYVRKKEMSQTLRH